MLIRALIVLLIALNLGAAAWWIARPDPLPVAIDPQPPGVVKLRLLSEPPGSTPAEIQASGIVQSNKPPATAPADAFPAAPVTSQDQAAAPAPSSVDVAAQSPPQCFTLGPFDAAATANTAASTLGGTGVQNSTRQVPGRSASGYNVYLPATGDRAAAQAMAARIGAAGFDDYLIINTGALANSIALGRYGSRQGAERRAAALQAAGFAARVQPIGNEGQAQWWLDVRATAGLSRPQAQALAASPQSRELDCATLR